MKIRFRRGTAAAWTAKNPVLASGEPGVETDTRLTKVGDGSTAWSALPYQGNVGKEGGAAAKQGLATLGVGGTVTVNTTAVTANSRIFLTPQQRIGIAAPAPIGVTSRVPGTSFTIDSSNAADVSTVAWMIVEPV